MSEIEARNRSGMTAPPTYPWWLAVACYFSVVSLAHLEFSIWLVRSRATQFGVFAFKDLVPFVAVTSGVALTIWLLWMARRSPRPGPALAYWLIWALYVALFDRYLTFSINEYAHYPQYAALAWLLARALDPDRSRLRVAQVLFWATLLGMVDEVQQYVWIAPNYGMYLDFNDFFVNLVGAAAGVLVYYGFKPAGRFRLERRLPLVEILLSVLLCVGVAAGLQTGRLAMTPPSLVPPGGLDRGADGVLRLYLQRRPGAFGSFEAGPYRGRYWILDPLSGLALMLGAGMMFATLPRVMRQRPDSIGR